MQKTGLRFFKLNGKTIIQIAARQPEIYKNSPSYKFFIDQLEDILCHYTNFQK
mgnify:FL=1|jgi:hypothetical protein